MSSSSPHSFGTSPRVTIFGQSHDPEIGVTIENLPSGITLDYDAIDELLTRRRPGGIDRLVTARIETDEPQIRSGVVDGVTTGEPLTATFTNADTRGTDYEQFAVLPRPSHVDYLARQKYGDEHDIAGGGRFSARLTLPLCFAGAVCMQILRARGVAVCGRLVEAGGNAEAPYAAIEQTRDEGDSVGGIVEVAATGLPPGVGEHPYGGVEPVLASLLFAIPGVRGVEFGEGFAAARMRGSEHNDPWKLDEDGRVVPATNHAGGVIGGMTTGEALVVRIAFKPTASIARGQQTLNVETGVTETLAIKGRHDPCIAVRGVPVAEAAVAVGLLNLLNAEESVRGIEGGVR